MRTILILLALALACGLGWGQTPMEAREGATVLELTAEMETEDGSATFVVGDQDTVRSGIYNAWKFTAVQFTMVGDSTAVKHYFYGGTADRLTAATANDDTKNFVLMDSLTVSAAGTYARQISDWMSKCEYFYVESVGQSGNGHETYMEEVKAYRERY